MTKIDPAVKARWVAALRSGEYTQTQGALRRGDSFCCLGVLCDLYAKDGHAEWQKGFDQRYMMLGNSGLIPDAVNDWAGLPYDSMGHVKVKIGRYAHSLPQFNDGSGDNEPIQARTFAEIADAIEAQL